MSGSFVHKSIVGGCRGSVVLLASVLFPWDTRKLRISSAMVTARRLAVIALAALLASIAYLTTIEDDAGYPPQELTPTSLGPVRANLDPRREVVSRLRDILRIREEAYRSRNPDDLRLIYSSDCPCLANDEKAISELLARGHRWEGISTSIEVRGVSKINERLWTVVLLLRSKALRIETLGGRPIRIEPAGSDLFEFTMVKPLGGEQWLLGLVSDVEVR